MSSTTPAEQFKCQICFVSFSNITQLELHIDAYTVRALETSASPLLTAADSLPATHLLSNRENQQSICASCTHNDRRARWRARWRYASCSRLHLRMPTATMLWGVAIRAVEIAFCQTHVMPFEHIVGWKPVLIFHRRWLLRILSRLRQYFRQRTHLHRACEGMCLYYLWGGKNRTWHEKAAGTASSHSNAIQRRHERFQRKICWSKTRRKWRSSFTGSSSTECQSAESPSAESSSTRQWAWTDLPCDSRFYRSGSGCWSYRPTTTATGLASA